MAVDTRNKRASCLGIARTPPTVFPNPDGTIAQPDRQHTAYCYPGITASAPGGANLMAIERAVFRRVFGRVFGRVN